MLTGRSSQPQHMGLCFAALCENEVMKVTRIGVVRG